jgi:hypothetical protein
MLSTGSLRHFTKKNMMTEEKKSRFTCLFQIKEISFARFWSDDRFLRLERLPLNKETVFHV